MNWLLAIMAVILAYLIGSVPIGLLAVKLITGKDIRSVQSGRTGGTNAMRAGGPWAGLLTATGDVFKAASAVWLARYGLGAGPWVEVAAGLFAVIGHNYSIFLIEKNDAGRWRLRGGAGGAPTIGAAMALWPVSIFITVPVGLIVVFGLGYASVATMSIALTSIVIFSLRAYAGHSPWAYVAFGVVAEVLLIWALRPNISRLFKGTERLVGWRAKLREKQENLKVVKPKRENPAT
jgi:acyl phosphate:glycerol-3-phosphate acyltransferase